MRSISLEIISAKNIKTDKQIKDKISRLIFERILNLEIFLFFSKKCIDIDRKMLYYISSTTIWKLKGENMNGTSKGLVLLISIIAANYIYYAVKISKIKKMKSLEESQVVELNFSKSIQIISMLVMAILVIMLTWSMGW